MPKPPRSVLLGFSPVRLGLRGSVLRGLVLSLLLSLWTGGRASGQGVTLLEAGRAEPYPTLGPIRAPVTLELFLDPNKGLSSTAIAAVRELSAHHPERLRVVFRLTGSLERVSNRAIYFAQEAFEQGRFFEFFDVFYSSLSPKKGDPYPQITRAAGMNYQRVLQAFSGLKHQQILSANYFYFRRMKLRGLPSILVNGRAVNLRQLSKLEDIFDEEYGKAQRRAARGIRSGEIRDLQKLRDGVENLWRHHIIGATDIASQSVEESPSHVSMANLSQGGVLRGAADAAITMIFVCHLQSPWCRSMSQDLGDILNVYPSKVRVIFHPLYNSDLPGQSKAELMHVAALCAQEQGRYWEYFQEVFSNLRRLNYDRTLAIEVAESPSVQLAVIPFMQCLDSGRMEPRLAKEIAQVRASGLVSTPTLIVNGVPYLGRRTFSQILMLVERELSPDLLQTLAAP